MGYPNGVAVGVLIGVPQFSITNIMMFKANTVRPFTITYLSCVPNLKARDSIFIAWQEAEKITKSRTANEVFCAAIFDCFVYLPSRGEFYGTFCRNSNISNLEPSAFSLFDMWKDGKNTPGIIIFILLPDWSYTFVTLRHNYVIFAFAKEIRFYIGSFENIMETFPLRCICIVFL